MITDCIIIGAGASGLMAAIAAAKQNRKVILVDHGKRVGSKILQTGNGKCNITNLNMNKTMYQNEDTDFVMSVIDKFNVNDTLEFFHSIGVFTKDKNGYVYPNSETASSVLDALRFEAEELGVTILTEFYVDKICRKEAYFEVVSKSVKIKALSMIVCCGSMAAPKSGSDGSGYDIAKVFNHKVIKPLPALVQLISDDKHCKAMSGVRSTGSIKIVCDGEILSEDLGEIQYTDYGISGIPVFQVSRYAVKALYNKKNISAIIDMLPNFDNSTLFDNLNGLIKEHPERELIQLFSGLINKKLLHVCLQRVGLKDNDISGLINEKKLKRLVEELKEFKLNVTGNKSFENAQVCQGGVRLDEIDSSTMESKKVKNLFFAGEILDVDGKCGGYNLQWSWSSGFVAGLNAGKVKKN